MIFATVGTGGTYPSGLYLIFPSGNASAFHSFDLYGALKEKFDTAGIPNIEHSFTGVEFAKLVHTVSQS